MRTHALPMSDARTSGWDLSGLVRRIRRRADVSQRELAERLGVSKSRIAAAETGHAGLDVRLVAEAAALAGLRLALVDEAGEDVGAMSSDAVRDRGDRRFPAHLDTRYGDDRWWHDLEPRYGRARPWYTFDRSRNRRDAFRRSGGTPADHQLPQPGDSPQERAEARRREALRRRTEESRRRSGRRTPRQRTDWFDCTCPATCDELDDRSGRPVHATGCPCSCDVG